MAKFIQKFLAQALLSRWRNCCGFPFYHGVFTASGKPFAGIIKRRYEDYDIFVELSWYVKVDDSAKHYKTISYRTSWDGVEKTIKRVENEELPKLL